MSAPLPDSDDRHGALAPVSLSPCSQMATPPDPQESAGPGASCFALLDDAQCAGASSDNDAPIPLAPRTSRLYTGFVREHRCTDPTLLDAAWAGVERDLATGLHAVVLGDYEWGVALAMPDACPDSGAALRVLCFRHCARLTPEQTDAFLASIATSPAMPSGIADVSASVTPDAFDAAIAAIHRALHAGESYQINYTFRLRFGVYGDPIVLYRQLRARQPVAFGALIRASDGWVLSVSPELFVRHEHGVIHAKPMKGTAARVLDDPDRDALAARTLQSDEKNRAENVMIVDLLRNDLGRIAQVGSVQVTRLFEVDPLPSVWQMTSTVRATLAPRVRFPDVLRALFPCGSITGAPKHASMALIRQIETTPRGLYTGTIGWIEPAPAGGSDSDSDSDDDDGRQCGAFCLSVTIRTITIHDPQVCETLPTDGAPEPIATERTGLLAGEAGIGAGIVLDSRAADEYEECWLKARFLTGADPGFALFETIALDLGAMRADAMPYLPRHLARLQHAARRLGFACPIERVLAAIDDRIAALRAAAPMIDSVSAARESGVRAPSHRLRLALSKDGTVHCTAAPMAPLPSGPVGVLMARDHGYAPTQANDFLLRFKTTARAQYDMAWQAAAEKGAFDMLFENTAGELTEGGRSNVYLQLDGQWFTPPLQCGLLPGVMRQAILDGAVPGAPSVTERVLQRKDVARAQACALSNGLRGWFRASLAH
ncbi:chorismate-binding protein [Robbsia sp. KACC 23696]|uniref:chorismate-binding protein n=1 Tax=Robbsia sp. KACC 23696 TaxID=3149231 RepID=UPI00325AECDC